MERDKYSDIDVLLGDLREGIRPAYTYIFKCYANELMQYILVICRSKVIAEEIVQQTFVNFWDKRKRLAIKHNIKGYLFRMAYNLYKDLQKKHAKKLVLLQELQYSATLELMENNPADTEHKLKLLNKEINKLPKKCKTAFILRKKQGLTYAEISEKMNISVKTVEGHIAKAMARLKNRLG
ncbi:MAG: sigma-70 family RNA polymerase sigma factor [Pricia sp.]